MPLCIIPDLSELPEHLLQSARAKGADVFNDDPRRLDLVDEAEVFAPEAGALAGEARPFAGEADVLAGEAASDDIELAASSAKMSNVAVDGRAGEPLGEDGSSIKFDLAHGGDSEAGALEAELEPADAAEQAEHYSLI